MIEGLAVGKIVRYVLTEQDAAQVNRRRVVDLPKRIIYSLWPQGAQAHVGNAVKAGAIVPAIVVYDHQVPDGRFNGQAFLDGNDTLWLSSVPNAEGVDVPQGTWHFAV
jgi:hypothetical protein